MKLSQLISSTGTIQSGADIDVLGLAYDSRRVKPGYLFVAVPGLKTDGHLYIKDAVAAGAVAVVAEKPAGDIGTNVAGIITRDSRRALARMASEFYGRPSERLKLIGITGTNGKTTTAYLLEAIFRRAGQKTGLIGTVEYRIDGARMPAERTTPESLDLQRTLASMVEAGVDTAVIEVSSHALHLKRIDDCAFAARIFMNLSQDHLDFHTDLEAYFQAKSKLFATDFGEGLRLANVDDEYGRRLAADYGEKMVTFGVRSGQYRAEDVRLTAEETSFTLVGPAGNLPVRSRLLGAFNVMNLTAAAAAALELGIGADDVAAGLLKMDQVPGRFETVACGQDFKVLIDYAHTPDGLEKVLSAARQLAGSRRLITVFGCGGDRDKGKRPKMGAIAAGLSDIAIVTSDNPRSEPPESIIDDILAGVPENAPASTSVIAERGQAIKAALREAQAGDVVIIAGKGHEDYQILNDRVIHFDDRSAAEEALKEILSGTN